MFRTRSATEPLLPSATAEPNPNDHHHLNTGNNNNGHNVLDYDSFSKQNPKAIIAIRPIQAGHASRPGHISIWRVILVFFLLVIPLLLLVDLDLPDLSWPGSSVDKHNLCPQEEALYPVVHAQIAEEVISVYESPEFLGTAVASLSGAVKIATEISDEMGPVGEDPGWTIFNTFHAYLYATYPLIHEHLKLTKVNTYGLVYEWTGSESLLKPLLYTAHQDVVPVDPTSYEKWTHPPWSGHYDGEWIWGRGSMDDKASLTTILLSIETLLKHGFKPKRTVVLAFGFDEEAGGRQGAGTLGPYLEETYGTNGISMLVDEGGRIVEEHGALFAEPAIGEKGYLDVKIEVTTPGGHSSVPPPDHHTGIGLLSSILVLLESNTLPARLSRSQPIYASIKCFGEHAPLLPEHIRRYIRRSVDNDKALRKVEENLFKDNRIKSTTGTTQAIDMIQGGVKSNALPELSWAIVNHRIATDSSLAVLKEHYIRLIRDWAIGNNTTLTAFGETILDQESARKIELSDAWGTALEPAPVSPIDGLAFKILSGTIHAAGITTRNVSDVMNKDNGDREKLFVAPSVNSGNSDTRHYWNLTKNIFRYNHVVDSSAPNIHTVNEHIRARALIGQAKFYTYLLLNVDEATEL